LYTQDIQQYLESVAESHPPMDLRNTSVLAKWTSYLDKGITAENWRLWFEKQAPVYLVANTGREKELCNVLSKKDIPFEEDGSLIKTGNSPELEGLVSQGLARVQDKGTALSLAGIALSGNVWDCCSGAGGKSLYIAQNSKNTNLFCSDIRPGILENLAQRFELAGFRKPKTAAIDLQKKPAKLRFDNKDISSGFFDTIIADVPCSGSGTWRHNPEQAHFFDGAGLQAITQLQQQIVSNALPYLKENGRLVYITCSVFQCENEENVAQICKANDLVVESTTYTGGLEEDSDYIFRAVLKRRSDHLGS
jgi:16S rRNA (cytosine967-C5)-methyltransferase